MVSLHAFVLAAALSGSGDLVLLDFGAEWCAPCRSMDPTIERLQEAGYPVRRVNVEQDPELAQQFAVGPIPCFVLVQNGREIQRVVGATSFDRLAQMFQQANSGLATAEAPGMRGQSPDQQFATPVNPANMRSATSGIPPITPPPAVPQQRPASSSTTIHQLALQATVRLRVVDATGQSHGTGTIIDTHGDEALILTCGHIFRESQGRGEIFVELFAPGTRGPISGQLLSYECEKRDFGLVSFRPDVSVTPMKVGSTDRHPRPGEPIFSVGCDHGQNPTVRVSAISAVDRYTGPPNIEILGHPVEGRSGGGLFTADGCLIGICNAADMQEDRGIFAALPTVHYALTNIGLQQIYLNQSPVPSASLAGTQALPSAASVAEPDSIPVVPASMAADNRTLALPERVMGDEIICVVRSSESLDGRERVIVVRDPSPELLQRLASESQPRTELGQLPPSPRTSQDMARHSANPVRPEPVVRAQGY